MKPFRPSTLQERETYYRDEFSVEKLAAWFREHDVEFPQLYAVDMGTETKIIKDQAKLGKIIYIRADNLGEKLVHYLPEDTYYDRNRYKDPDLALRKLNFRQIFDDPNFLGQELAFDIDPENISCFCKATHPGFCRKCMRESVVQGIKLAEKLGETFTRLGLVHSGRGIHIHIFDKQAYNLSMEEREKLNKELKEFPIDPWVSRGRIHLIRVPYSLNGLVSRIVMPLSLDEATDFDPFTSEKTLPEFMKG